jgi:hypothetical protein
LLGPGLNKDQWPEMRLKVQQRLSNVRNRAELFDKLKSWFLARDAAQ